MKALKILSLVLFTLLMVTCNTDDDSNSNITFFEKYDGIVWEEVTEFNYLNRIQFINGNTITVKSYGFEEPGDEDCVSHLLYSTHIIELNEDSFVIFNEVSNNGVDESFTTTITVFNDGNELMAQDSDEPDYPDYFIKTALTDPCE